MSSNGKATRRMKKQMRKMKITLKEVTHQGGSNWFQILVEIRNQASQPIYEAQK